MLVCDGQHVYLRDKVLDLNAVEQQSYRPHLYSSAGLLDDNWWHRSYWLLGERTWGRASGWHVIPNFRPSGRILDIGCGFGFFLHLMQERGWEVHGCDLSQVAAEHATEQLGLTRIRCGHFQKHHYPADYFDVISAWYVLHHVSNPRQVLKKAHASLKSGGIIALRVPNLNLFRYLWWLKKLDCHGLRMLLRSIRKETADARVPYNVLDPPVHLYAFTPKVLARFLEDVGFLVIKIYNDGMVNRGNVINRVVDGTITGLAEMIKLISKNKVDLSISFSIYARKE